MEEVKDVLVWLKHNDTLMNEWGMSRKLKRGFRMLFYGPPGTGKTLTASLLGKQMDMEVYRVDLSQIVSKYIGETEKNMGSLFDQAENRNWILFFDEADALFGSRTATSSSNDKHANQEVAYLLQRVEDYPGVVILASNLKGNIDEAFSRRFQSMILFPIPNADERHRLWKSIFSKKVIFDGNIDLFDIAEEYELAGGAIINVVRYASLKALSRNTNMIELNDILQGIKREFRKEGKTISI
jgi:SpoVK/Ycf46/Vps4 family AAA+-type ATPase